MIGRTVTVVAGSEADPSLLDDVRELLIEAFEGDFTDEDWAHTLGGLHVTVHDATRLVGHAAVVPRVLEIDSAPYDAGYVEGVATAADLRNTGVGTLAMRAAAHAIRATHELGALSTGTHGFYERLGWERWSGPTSVKTADGRHRTPEEDGGVMVLRFGRSATLDLGARITCESRPGDDW